MEKGTNKRAVINMTSPRITDLVAAAPEYPNKVSPRPTGADSSS
jgi:hypothetical protein